MYQKIKSLAPISLTAGTSAPITTDDIDAWTVIVQADKANGTNIYVGDSTVTDFNGIELAAGESFTLDAHVLGDEVIKLQDIYINSDSTGNIIRIMYLTVRGS